MTEVVGPVTQPTEGPEDPELPDDMELIVRVRAGNSVAFEELFRRHRDVALRYARRIAGPDGAEDLCAEAFAKIFDLLQRSKGPEVAFRAYLLTTVRTSYLNTLRVTGRENLVADHEQTNLMRPVVEDPDARFDQQAIFRAFSQLPERWQTALWMTEVEGQSHEQVGEYLGIRPNAVASLTFRARAGLRQAYLAAHLLATDAPACRTVLEQLPNYQRDPLTSRRRRRIEEHLAGCRSCCSAALEINEVDGRLGAILAPLALLTTGTALGATKTSALLATCKSGFAAVGTKAAVTAGVVALGVTAGLALVRHQSSEPTAYSRSEVAIAPRVRPPATPPTRTTLKPSRATSSGPSKPPQRVHPSAPLAVAVPDPALPKPAPSAGATPTAPPPTTGPPAAHRSMAFGPATQRSHTNAGGVWHSVEFPVLNPVAGTTLEVATTRTLVAALAVTGTTGWTCNVPLLTWIGQSPDTSTRIVCTYGGTPVSSAAMSSAAVSTGALRFDYLAEPAAALNAQLIPPAGYVDSSGSDHLLHLLLG
jgi:RNA polymerase sigma factor (sigma-70 family)